MNRCLALRARIDLHLSKNLELLPDALLFYITIKTIISTQSNRINEHLKLKFLVLIAHSILIVFNMRYPSINHIQDNQ